MKTEKEKQGSTTFPYMCVEHLSRGNCHCQSSRPDVETNLHWPSCMVGTAQAYRGLSVTWRQGKSKEEPLVCSPEATAPDYVALAVQVGELVTRKQVQYGDSFTVAPKILALLYPDGVQPEHYDTLLAVVRILDKLKRVATQHESDAEDAWSDICGYSLLVLAKRRRNNHGVQ